MGAKPQRGPGDLEEVPGHWCCLLREGTGKGSCPDVRALSLQLSLGTVLCWRILGRKSGGLAGRSLE